MKVRLLIGSLNIIAITANCDGRAHCGIGGSFNNEDPRDSFGWHCKNGQHNCPINASCIDKKPSGFTCECNQGKRSKIII